ncbi:putative phosphatase regulatory subunit-domain-containing protein [Thamnidium elegans]|nr:putative phosphatase regulatory subunit-domain-containing protein [Thamnidium elegans]
MTSTLSPHSMPLSNQCKRRVLLKRSTHQMNDPYVIQQIKNDSKKKTVRFQSQDQVRYFYKNQSANTVKMDPPMMDNSIEDFKLSLPHWPTRNNIFYNTEQKIRMETVSLVNGDYELMSQNKFLLEGRCRAMNLSFHKLVSIRYSFDLWRTYKETTGEFRESIASTSNTWDRFVFNIPMDAKQNVQSLYLALRYTVGDQEFWDNNNGMNYEVVINCTNTIEQEQLPVQEQDLVTNITKEDEEELALMKDNTKVLGRRYDFTASLSAARKPYFASPPPSPPGTPVDNEDNFSYTPPVFFDDSSSLSQETTYRVENNKKPEPAAATAAAVVAVKTPPTSAEGFQMSYSDFVSKYCFYNSHSNPIYSTFSTCPSAVLS